MIITLRKAKVVMNIMKEPSLSKQAPPPISHICCRNSISTAPIATEKVKKILDHITANNTTRNKEPKIVLHGHQVLIFF